MWFYILNFFILLLFQHFVLNETSLFFSTRRLTKQAEFGLKPSTKLKKSETMFAYTYSNGTKVINLAYSKEIIISYLLRFQLKHTIFI